MSTETQNVTTAEEIPTESEELLDRMQAYGDVSNHTSTNVSTPNVDPEVVEASATECELSGTTKFEKENDSLNVWRRNVNLVQLQSFCCILISSQCLLLNRMILCIQLNLN